jgi:tRNA dimethylallyltransferase
MKAIYITGPTGVGKSSLAHALALKLKSRVVVCDSIQIFKNFNVGSSKPSPEMLRTVKYSMLSHYDPTAYTKHNPMTARVYAQEAMKALEAAAAEGKVPVIEGSSTLYLKFLLYADQVTAK